MTGYDVKKIMQESIFMHWSGNNNQIYKALAELLGDGFVTNEIKYQESVPPKKIYTITREGLYELKEWAASALEPAEFRKSFLIQLAWADLLGNEELHEILAKYENEIMLQMILNREKIRRGNCFASRTGREAFLWRMIDENILSSYQNELEWIQNVRRQLSDYGLSEVREKMNYKIIENKNTKYIEVFSCETPVKTEQDALELVALCGENDTNLLMIHDEALSEDFFKLKTGVAGAVLQKFINYSVKAAIIIPDQSRLGPKFMELVSEANKGNQYRIFASGAEAENWFLRI
jgi:DNA-binding PadR family transcriptional regulator